jgi:hypothetical protein
MSAGLAWYVPLVAPAMFRQLPPFASQRRHW